MRRKPERKFTTCWRTQPRGGDLSARLQILGRKIINRFGQSRERKAEQSLRLSLAQLNFLVSDSILLLFLTVLTNVNYSAKKGLFLTVLGKCNFSARTGGPFLTLEHAVMILVAAACLPEGPVVPMSGAGYTVW